MTEYTLLEKSCYTPFRGNKIDTDRIFVLPMGWNWHEITHDCSPTKFDLNLAGFSLQSQMVSSTGPTHTRLQFLTSPCCSGSPAPVNAHKANNGLQTPLGWAIKDLSILSEMRSICEQPLQSIILMIVHFNNPSVLNGYGSTMITRVTQHLLKFRDQITGIWSTNLQCGDAKSLAEVNIRASVPKNGL